MSCFVIESLSMAIHGISYKLAAKKPPNTHDQRLTSIACEYFVLGNPYYHGATNLYNKHGRKFSKKWEAPSMNYIISLCVWSSLCGARKSCCKKKTWPLQLTQCLGWGSWYFFTSFDSMHSLKHTSIPSKSNLMNSWRPYMKKCSLQLSLASLWIVMEL